MRFRSLSNSRKHEDIQLRRDYATLNTVDEWEYQLRVRIYHGAIIEGFVGPCQAAEEINHVYSNPRRDVWSNLIALTRESHQWFHSHLREGRVLCILAKLEKQRALGTLDECVIADLDLCCGRHVVGVLGNYDFAGNPLMLGMQERCLRRLGELTREAE